MAKRVIIQDEFEFKGQMKELTGGDSLFPDGAINHFRESNAIYARSLKHDPSDKLPEFRLILTCNNIPVIPHEEIFYSMPIFPILFNFPPLIIHPQSSCINILPCTHEYIIMKMKEILNKNETQNSILDQEQSSAK